MSEELRMSLTNANPPNVSGSESGECSRAGTVGGQASAARRHANSDCGKVSMRKGDDIAERLLDFAAGVVNLLPALSNRPGAANVVKQLERCGPAGGANYEEARGAESRADFVHKVRIALKEVREARYWLRLIVRARLLEPSTAIADLIDEAGELVAILTASSVTAKRRA
ncbi:MAG: four helix bundle protein [Deltaproteobacteria bacterium]|nr:four helix bundle protein [Deltaproteobacteria bacterium]